MSIQTPPYLYVDHYEYDCRDMNTRVFNPPIGTTLVEITHVYQSIYDNSIRPQLDFINTVDYLLFKENNLIRNLVIPNSIKHVNATNMGIETVWLPDAICVADLSLNNLVNLEMPHGISTLVLYDNILLTNLSVRNNGVLHKLEYLGITGCKQLHTLNFECTTDLPEWLSINHDEGINMCASIVDTINRTEPKTNDVIYSLTSGSQSYGNYTSIYN